MLTPEMAGEKLKEMRIFTAPEVVMKIVQLLQAGTTQYRIYNPPIGEDFIASNNTVFKIKKLLDAGKLDFLTDELAELNVGFDEMGKASNEDQKRNIKHIKGWEIEKDDGEGRFRLVIIRKAEEPRSKDWGWSVTNLERIGVPDYDALKILQEYDDLYMARVKAEVIGNDYTYLIKFRGFERYLYLHHLVYLMRKYPNPPFQYAHHASALYTRGIVATDESIWTAGEGILMYAIWRRGKYQEAYKQSLKRYKRTPKRNAQLIDQIDHLLKGKWRRVRED